MMMYTAEEFLAKLNENSDDKSGTYRFQGKVDFVRIGTCSNGQGHGHSHDVSGESCNVPNRELYEHLFSECPQNAIILVLSDCCGQYSHVFQERIQAMFPQFMWTFPRQGNYSEFIVWREVARDLLSERVLVVVR